jgi:dsRNA-specific ribonuclease
MNINFIKENIYFWRVTINLNKYEVTTDLKQDLNELIKRGEEPKIEYEVIFNDDYPISPPFFRVV